MQCAVVNKAAAVVISGRWHSLSSVGLYEGKRSEYLHPGPPWTKEEINMFGLRKTRLVGRQEECYYLVTDASLPPPLPTSALVHQPTDKGIQT